MVCASGSQSWQCWGSQGGCGRSCCPCRAITFSELLLYLGQRVEKSLLVLWDFTDMKDKVSELPQLHFLSTATLRYL